MRSLPALPSIVSAAFVPRRRSLPGPPWIVAAYAVAGTRASVATAAAAVRRLKGCMRCSAPGSVGGNALLYDRSPRARGTGLMDFSRFVRGS
jgi:hypothetical protein